MCVVKTCRICGKQFETKYARQEVCKDIHYGTCVICGNRFVLKPPYTAKTCSKHCAHEYSKQTGGYERWQKKSKDTMLRRYGVEHALQNKDILAEMHENNLHKYGVSNPMQNSEIKQKAVNTNLQKYGVENVSKSEKVKSKIQSTFQEKYGVNNAMQVPEFAQRQRASTRASCGFEFAMQNPEIQDKAKQTNLERYGTEFPTQSKLVQDKRDESVQLHYGVHYLSQCPEIQSKIRETCLQRYGVPYNCMRKECRSSYRTISKYNLEFKQFLSCQGVEVDEMEFSLDRYSFDFKLGNILIELDPTITHNSYMSIFDKTSTGIDKQYHATKSEVATTHGFRCIHVFDWDDWYKISTLLQPSTILHARTLQVKEISSAECNQFERLYHLQSDCYGQQIRLGLYNGDALVEIMTFGQPRYSKKYEWELLRLCTHPHYRIVGGSERLFSHFIRAVHPISIISYCDLSKFSGSVYSRIGMKLDHISPPSKHWSKGSEHITDNLLRSRGYDQLFGTAFGKGTNNEQLMLENGWLPVHDCGQAVYIACNL